MSIVYSPTSSVFFHEPYSEALVSPNIYVSTISPLSPFNLPLTVNLDYSKPLVSVYDTIDNQPNVRKTMLNYYYDFIRDKWLLDELNDILNYFTYKDGKVELIKNLADYSPNNIAKDSDETAEKKVKFIEKNIFTKYDLLELLDKFTRETNTKWVNLPKNEFFLRQATKEYILKKIIRKLRKNQ